MPFDLGGCFLRVPQVPDGLLLRLTLATIVRLARDCCLQVRIKHLIGVQFGAVTGQVEHLDVWLVLLQPRLHGLGVGHFQVINQGK